jgi:Tol biopolymer transport system component
MREVNRIRRGILTALLAVSACGGADNALPKATYLSPEGANHRNSRFSPDGSQVAYWTPAANGWDLVVAKADLSDPRTVVTGAFTFNAVLWSPDGKLLAFQSDAASVADVAVVPAAGGEVRRLTDAPGVEFPVNWHPKGDLLAYLAVGEGGVFHAMTVSLATGQSSPLLPDSLAGPVVWSPDGARMGFGVNNRGSTTLWVADGSGANPKQLTTEGQEFGGGGWSPDGLEALYVSRRTGTGDIWVLPADGGKPRQLTRDVRDDNNPVWSPDGKWVAFGSNRGRQTDLWVVPAAGGTELRVTDDAAEEGGHRFIGNSNRIAFQVNSAVSALWAVTVADGKERQITPDSIRVGSFRVSPDGKEVVYQVLRGGGVSDLQVASLVDGTRRTLIAGTAEHFVDGYSPDGKTILFESNRSGNQDVWSISAAGGEPRQLTNWATNEHTADWAPDGSAVYFISSRDAKIGDIWSVPVGGGEPTRVTTVGNVNNLAQSSTGPDLFVNLLGGRGGQLTLAKVQPGGTLQTLWDRSNVLSVVSQDGVTPSGDSVVIYTAVPGGGQTNYLISTRTGQGREILGKGDVAGDFSPDGTMLSYNFGRPMADIGILNLKDGTTRRLTNTPENEAGYWWTRDSKTIVVARRAPRARIATVDLTSLLARAKP